MQISRGNAVSMAQQNVNFELGTRFAEQQQGT
jgi:hypothetical protein